MDRTHGDEQRLSAPLTKHLELRPRNETPVSLRQMLGPMLDRAVQDIEESAARLRDLANEAASLRDHKAEAALRAKIVDQATAILRVCREEASPAEETWQPRSQDDLPRMELLPPRVREQFEEGYRLLAEAERLAEEMWGPTWEQRWYDLSGVVRRWPK